MVIGGVHNYRGNGSMLGYSCFMGMGGYNRDYTRSFTMWSDGERELGLDDLLCLLLLRAVLVCEGLWSSSIMGRPSS